MQQHSILGLFFKTHPALFTALLFLVGTALSFRLDPIFFLIGAVLILPCRKKPRTVLLLFLIPLLAFINAKMHHERFPQNQEVITGQALVHLKEIKEQKNHFKKNFLFKGLLHMEQEQIANIPCSFPIPPALRPLTTSRYLIYGTLEKKENGYSFTPDNHSPWRPLQSYFCLAEWRFQMKAFLSKKIQAMHSNTGVAQFLSTLVLGDLPDPLLRFSFSRLGLQHILAISGFHFGLLAFFIGSLLRLFFSPKIAFLGLMLSLTAYFLFLSSSPSITRAYLALMLYLIGRLNKRQTSPLNIFGAVLLIELVLEPSNLIHLGFQLSFLATGSILLLYPITFSWMEKFFPKRTDVQVLSFPTIDKGAYLLCCFLRSTLALNLAVHLTTIPVCLFCFHQFPIASFLYNLFIPIAVCASLFLFLSSLPLFFLCRPIASFLTGCNEQFTQPLLRVIKEAPNCLDFSLSVQAFSPSLLFIVLILAFSLPFIRRLKDHSRHFFT